MKINIKAETTYKYLQVFNGILELTDKEMVVLSKFVDLSTTVNICSAENKKEGSKGYEHRRPQHSEQLRKESEGQGCHSKKQRMGTYYHKLLQSTTEIHIVR